ncbi:MAG: phosphoribosylformylglycinamidine cyclo-ligase [Bryobacteraceae bacterium]|nr:phosphoribosylformylglycinamidine cyclo-ligase [Bryobacteraceae bacterium]
MQEKKRISYKDAGVNISEADKLVGFIKPLAGATFTGGVLTGIGSFGGGFHLKGWKDPVLVSSIDGAGTKVKVACLARKHDTIGQDLVNHCVNDIMVQGASPLFFLDYFATGKLNAKVGRDVIAGMARACQENACVLIGGETAEMPGVYGEGDYDIAGCIIGAVERKRLITGSAIRNGDVLLGLPSTGLHTNGYSLARKLLFDVSGYTVKTRVKELGCTVGQELLKVHRSYRAPIQALHKAGVLKGAAHITGGGITDNLPRVLGKGLAAEVDPSTWPELPVFSLLKRIGNMGDADYRRTLNTGIGMILVVAPAQLAAATRLLDRLKEPWYRIGRIVKQATGERVIYQ